jgi:hypothetical protein
MSRLFILNEASIADLLGRHADSVEATGRQQWQFHLGRGGGLDASLRIDRGWLQVSAPLGGDCPRDAGDRPDDCSDDRLQAMLAANARIGGGVKFVLAGDPPRPFLAGEIPLAAEEDLELDERIGQLCRGLGQGAREWRHPLAERGIPPGGVRQSAPAADEESRFEEICRESGWTVSRRGKGRFAVRLDVREAFYQAQVEPAGEGCRLCAALGQSVFDVDVCRRAAGVLLLAACGLVRMAAATVVPGDAAWQYRWEAVLAGASQPKEWDHALSALTIACQTTALELAALEDPALAEAYLQLRGTGRTSP